MFPVTVGQVAAGLLFVYFLSLVKTYFDDLQFRRQNGCKPVKRLPQQERIIGWAFYKRQSASARDKTILKNAVQRFREMGNTFSMVMLGRTLVTTIEPENIKWMLATNFKDFGLGQREQAFGPMLGRGIFTSDGSRWEHSRALVRPNFTKVQVADLDTFETHIQHMLSHIPLDGSTVDLQTLFYKLTFDSATEFLFGESVDILRSPEGSEQQLFAAAFDDAQTQLGTRSRLGPFLPLYRNAKFDANCRRVHAFVDRFVFKALEYRKLELSANKEKRINEDATMKKYVFLQELAKATDDPKQLRDELLNILIAGRDTTAGLLSNTFHVLARTPDVWSKLQAEVNTLNGELPDYETLRNMKYLRNVLQEALRLYPSVPGNARNAKRNTTLPRGGGPDGQSPVFIKKGATVLYNVFSMHRCHDLYGPDADEFKPDRWDNLRVGWGYLPFNGGPRICVGQQFALTEASYTIVRICQLFQGIENRDPKEWREGLGLTLSSGEGTKVAMIPRSS